MLIVEDEAIVALDLRNRLTKLGYEVTDTATRGDDAVNLAETHRPDLVLMDIRLQGEMNGIDAAEIIRTRFKLPIVYLTAHADEATVNRACVTEPFGYILKPFEERELQIVIEMAIYKHKADAKQRETERRAEEQLRQSQKMEAIGQLANGVAHDFNNMLTVILNYTDILLNAAGADHPWSNFLTEIRKAGERSADLTRRLLAICRKQLTSPTLQDVNDVIVQIEPMLRRLISADIEIELQLEPDLGMVLADPGQLEQVLLNLVVNARDAISSYGKIAIETRNTIVDAGLISDFAPGCYRMIRFSDNGHGMLPSIRDRVFEPFFTTKDPGKGTGLGLSTVFGIVQQCRGKIMVESEIGTGSTFNVYLPAAIESIKPDLSSEDHRLPRGTETILLVEDERPIRDLTKQMLVSCGYQVIEAENGAHALQILSQSTRSIDLVVSDVVMPIMGARSMLEKIRERFPDIKSIYISGYNDQGIQSDTVGKDNALFLPKPFHMTELVLAIRKLLDQ